MRFSSTHAPPMVISTSCNTARYTISSTARCGAGSTAPVGSAVAVLA